MLIEDLPYRGSHTLGEMVSHTGDPHILVIMVCHKDGPHTSVKTVSHTGHPHFHKGIPIFLETSRD